MAVEVANIIKFPNQILGKPSLERNTFFCHSATSS